MEAVANPRRRAFEKRFSTLEPAKNFYQVICNICTRTETERTIGQLTQSTIGWHIGAEVGDPDYCEVCK